MRPKVPARRSPGLGQADFGLAGIGLAILGMASVLLALASGSPALSQPVAVPGFWDPRAPSERAELPGPPRIVRFLTDDEYPPLHFLGPDGTPTGFAVELARAVCEKLVVTCSVQVRRFDTLLDGLTRNQADVIAAAIAPNAALRARFAVTQPYFRLPARFTARTTRAEPAPDAANLAGRTVGAVSGTAHEAYLKAFFPGASFQGFPELSLAQGALRRGEVDFLFADGLALAVWMGGSESSRCCAFVGGPYLESRFFGEGIGFVVRKDDAPLRRAIDDALRRLHQEGRYAELYLRFFPVSPF